MAWITPSDSWKNHRLGTETNILEHCDDGPLISQNERVIGATYDYWPAFLMHGILYCLQTKTPVPYKGDWQQVFPEGRRGISTDDRIVLLEKIKFKVREQEPLLVLTDQPQRQLLFSWNHRDGYPLFKDGQLQYVSDNRLIARFDQLDMSDFFSRVLDPMMRGVRGFGFAPRKVYSEFPREAYEKVLGKAE